MRSACIAFPGWSKLILQCLCPYIKNLSSFLMSWHPYGDFLLPPLNVSLERHRYNSRHLNVTDDPVFFTVPKTHRMTQSLKLTQIATQIKTSYSWRQFPWSRCTVSDATMALHKLLQFELSTILPPPALQYQQSCKYPFHPAIKVHSNASNITKLSYCNNYIIKEFKQIPNTTLPLMLHNVSTSKRTQAYPN